MTDPFEDADIIDAYPDSQAVEDGVLVDIAGLGLTFRKRQVNRMTRALYEACKPFVVAFKSDPDIGLVDANEGDAEWAEVFAGMLRTKLDYAVDTAAPGEEPGVLFRLPGGGGDGPIWLVLNELGGFTVMFSSDY